MFAKIQAHQIVYFMTGMIFIFLAAFNSSTSDMIQTVLYALAGFGFIGVSVMK